MFRVAISSYFGRKGILATVQVSVRGQCLGMNFKNMKSTTFLLNLSNVGNIIPHTNKIVTEIYESGW